jgi:hypothetical protein
LAPSRTFRARSRRILRADQLTKTMNLTNEAILALLLELKAELAELRREVAALKATDAKIIDRIEVINDKINTIAEEMGMI